MNKETATESLAKHLGTSLPLPHIAQKSLEWALKSGDVAKKKLIEKLVEGLYCNDHKSYREKVKEALANFNITERG